MFPAGTTITVLPRCGGLLIPTRTKFFDSEHHGGWGNSKKNKKSQIFLSVIVDAEMISLGLLRALAHVLFCQVRQGNPSVCASGLRSSVVSVCPAAGTPPTRRRVGPQGPSRWSCRRVHPCCKLQPVPESLTTELSRKPILRVPRQHFTSKMKSHVCVMHAVRSGNSYIPSLLAMAAVTCGVLLLQEIHINPPSCAGLAKCNDGKITPDGDCQASLSKNKEAASLTLPKSFD